MAIKALAWMVRAFDAPVYCYHEIVHNQRVVARFEDLGVVFVNDIDEVPEGRPLMLSAHGSAPEVVEDARARGGFVVDAVCPLVTKVHHEVKVRAGKGFSIVYVGHEGHEEAVGTMAVAPESIHRVESIDEVAALPQFETSGGAARPDDVVASRLGRRGRRHQGAVPRHVEPGRSDLCFATTNRQSALMSIAERCDAVIVIGSANSSNTVALEKLARSAGCPTVLRINGVDELPRGDDGAVALTGTVGVTAGASAPEDLVEAILAALDPVEGVDEVSITDEDEYFPPPRNLRDLLAALDIIGGLGLGADPSATPPVNDRALGASEVLAQIP